MNRRALIAFVILNIAISIAVAIGVIALWQNTQGDALEEPVVQVFEVIITATPGPTQTPWVVTVQGSALDLGPGATAGSGEPTVAPTLNADILPGIATSAALTQVAVQAGGGEERTYTVQSNDFPSGIAESFGVSTADLLCANDLGTLDDPSFIYPGQVLIIPGAGFVCEPSAEAAAPSAASATPVATTLARRTAVPTATLAPTAENAQVVVVRVVGAGDVTSEGIELRNQGGLVDLKGWTLYDTEGNIYTFPDFRLFPSAGLTVFSRIGEDTPVALFWGETRALWQRDDVVSLANASGVVQSTFRVGSASN